MSRRYTGRNADLQNARVMWTKRVGDGTRVGSRSRRGRVERGGKGGDTILGRSTGRYTEPTVNHASVAIGLNFLRLRVPKSNSYTPATVSGTGERGRRDVIPREFPVSWEETSAPCQITGTQKTAGLLWGRVRRLSTIKHHVSRYLDEVSRKTRSKMIVQIILVQNIFLDEFSPRVQDRRKRFENQKEKEREISSNLI